MDDSVEFIVFFSVVGPLLQTAIGILLICICLVGALPYTWYMGRGGAHSSVARLSPFISVA